MDLCFPRLAEADVSMRRTLRELSPVFVIGAGWHPYQAASETTYVELGLTAVREALADAGIAWAAVDSTYVGTALLGMAPGRSMLKHLGTNDKPLVHMRTRPQAQLPSDTHVSKSRVAWRM